MEVTENLFQLYQLPVFNANALGVIFLIFIVF